MSEQLIKTPCFFGDNDNFMLEREIGSGGMGGVYLGRDKMLDRPVAVKVMLKEYGDDPDFVEKFKKEAQAVAKLIHPNIVQIYSYGICKGMPYMATELATGGSLYSIMQAKGMKPDLQRVVKICQQTAMALQCATDHGFVHGDVKPENILLDANGNAKLVDFGLAAMQKQQDEVWGTPYYISPERVRKEEIDFRADIYSLGGTLYHAITGQPPWDAEDMIEVIKKRFTEIPPKPSELRPEVSPALDELVMKMIAFDKNDRYPSFEALLAAFQEVLTSGLATSTTTSAAKPAATTTTKTVSTTKKMTVRGRRTTMMKRPGTTIKKKLEGAEGDEGALDAEESPKAEEEDDEEGGGNLAVKVVLFAVIGLVVIGAIIGGLIWYKISSDAAEKEEVRQQIEGGYAKAQSAINDTVKKAREFADEFDQFAMKAIAAVESPTKELKAMLPAEEGNLLKPAFSKELLDAIALTNPPPAVVAAPVATNAPAQAAAPAATNAPAAKAPQAKAQKSAPAPAAKPAEEKPVNKTPIVITMNELWDRAYGCQASAIRIRKSVIDLVKKSEESAEFKEVTRENMTKLADLSRQLVDLLDQIKTSKDVENVRKGITYIKSKGESAVKQTVKRLRTEKLEAERKAKAEANAAAEKARLEKEAADKKAKIEEESATAREKFDAIVAQGCIRQLDWKSAFRQLESMKDSLTTVEGQLVADLQIRKVNSMKKVQDILLKKAKGHIFKTGKKNRGMKLVDLNEKEVQLQSKDGKGKPQKFAWEKFYEKNPGALNELFNVYIMNGRRNSGLSLKDYAEALTGAALTMQLVMSEVNGATEKATQFAKEAVKQFPEYEKAAKEIFPDVNFSDEEDSDSEEKKEESDSEEGTKDGNKEEAK